MLEQTLTLWRPLTRVFDNFDMDGAKRCKVQAAIQAQDLLDRAFAQTNLVVLLQITLKAEPSGITVLLLEFENGVDDARLHFALGAMRSA